MNTKIKHTYFSEVENERIGYHELRFLSMRGRRYGNLDSIQMYLGNTYMVKGQKVYVYIMSVEVKVSRKAMVGNVMFVMCKEGWHSNLLCVWVWSVLQ